MIDTDGIIEVFIITNGRSTFPYCLNSVKSQVGIKFKTTIISNKPWLEANLSILDKCKSKYFVRVDDDMLIHNRAIEFMNYVVANQKGDVGMRQWRLWEPYSNKVCKGIKIYTADVARKIGFRVNEIGKIDKMFK